VVADVRQATSTEIPELARTLASAFKGDPVFTWLTPTRGREERLRRFFARQLKITIKHEAVLTTDDHGGAAIWLPPDEWKVATADIVRSLPTLLGTFGTRLPRLLGGLGIIEKRHPTEVPHWYLEFLGTRADMQRKGVGTTVIGFMLDRCDREGIPAYLEASSPENVPFYRRHGFEVTQDLPLKNGPTVWGMWREPR
jgi:GNAT superfamily N-acetyltransferase